MRIGYRFARRWYAWRRPSRRTVAVAAWIDGRVLSVSHSYKNGTSLPGGGLRRGEAPEQGAARELHEETGIWVVPDDLSLVDVVETNGRFGRRTTWVYQVALSHMPRIRCNGWETIGASLCEPASVPAIVALEPPVT